MPLSTEGPVIEASHLKVVRGGTTVLPDLSFSVAAGSVTGLLGPSGSGKSTLIRAIVGVQHIAGGEINVLGGPAGRPEVRGRVGYVTQDASVYEDLTVRENLRYFQRIAGSPRDAVEEVIEVVGLADFGNRVVGRLSGGQRSRVSLAAALVGKPDVLVLDEPTVGLDPVLRVELWSTFHRLAESGVTLMVSSHVMDEADECQRLLLMRDGHLVADTTPTGLRDSTGEADLGRAFLRLITHEEAA
ncbi:MAG: ABC transporter ATP-binding protein [Actinobacteria bacterium]|nr:ABC transporter ATP-binding protein [Thermoleophilia bacterium]MCB9010253.1 ABC transporter ATP-binding protein [Actinomycetota bacterium]